MSFKKNFKKKILPFAVVSSLAVTGFVNYAGTVDAKEEKSKTPEIKNVIFMIGDGMGVPYMTALRYMHDDPKTVAYEPTEFDPYLVGQQTTYAEDHEQNITDSASAATAMSGGVKTYNNAIAVDNDKSVVKTVLEQAKENGKATGLVATSEITHATPAAFGSHDESRKNMDQIADDYYDELINGQHKVDVLLGGGQKNFVRKDRDLTAKFKKDGYSYVTNRDELLKDQNSRILGLFASGGIDKMIDRTSETPSLKEMTTAAINRLNKDKDGFFLMVEGSQIDWGGHDNDIVASMSEMEDFEKAFKAAIDFAKKDGHTLVVATADHSTGGFSLGANDKNGNGIYNWLTAPIKAAKRTPDYMAAKIAAGADVEQTLKENYTLELTTEEIQSVKNAAVPKDGKINAVAVDNAIEAIINARSFTGWTTSGHTGEEVNVYAYGPGKEMFLGLIDNTDNAKNIFKILADNKAEKNKENKKGPLGKLEIKKQVTLYKETSNGLVMERYMKDGEVYRVYSVDTKNKQYRLGLNYVVKFSDDVKFIPEK